MSNVPFRAASRLLVGVVGLSAACAAAQFTRPATTRSTDPLAMIRDEGLNRSKVSETAEYLCNVIGPRLTASPNLRRANEWTRDTLTAWGLTDARMEPWGPFGRGWTLNKFAMTVTEPYPFLVSGVPKAWSPGFDAPLNAPVVYLDTKTEAGLAAYKDKLRGAIVLIGQPRQLKALFDPPATRRSDDALALLAQPTTGPAAELMRGGPTSGPATQSTTDVADPAGFETAAASRPRRATTRRARRSPATTASSTSPATQPGGAPATDLSALAFAGKALKFASDNGAACVVTPSTSGDGGVVFVTQATVPDETPRRGPDGATTRPRVWWPDNPPMPAQVTVSAEDFNRLVSLSRLNAPVKAEVQIKATFTADLPQQYNTIADIPGTDLADQVVMVGGHLDSWHAATGATDNVAGVVTSMEAVRLIKAAGLRPRRTIRVALWTGEEQGLLGSSAYVRQNLGTLSTDPRSTPATQPATAAGPVTRPATTPAVLPDANAPLATPGASATKPATQPVTVAKGVGYDTFAVYFNLDNGTGKIRGIFAENNPAAVDLFKEWIKPLNDLGVTTVAPRTTGSTDHVTFNRIGLPGFQFIQDPIEYLTRTHHSNIDTFDRLQIDDLKQASVVMATFLWNAANTNEQFPRKPLGK